MDIAVSLTYSDHITVVTVESSVFWSVTPCDLEEFEVFTAVTMKNTVFWDVALHGFIINRRFAGTCCLYLQGKRNNVSWMGLKVGLDEIKETNILHCW
jgi:hypothetical protein